MLEDVGEGDETALTGIDGADFLDAVAPVFEAENEAEEVILALCVTKIKEELNVGLLTEGEG